MNNNCIVICGPTASGKTRLAVEVARAAGGEIISADSRQVYRGMDIGTGKDLWEYGDVPYHLIDIADPQTVYTLYDYQRDFYKVFEDIRKRGRLPVIAGGSGLYIEAVLKGYDIPPVPENAGFRKSMMEKDYDALLEILRDEHPQIYAKTDISTKKRVVRALEVARFGGAGGGHTDSIDTNNAGTGSINAGKIVINPLILYVVWDRPELRARIEKRLRDRLAQGLVDEVAGLLRSGIDPERFALFGMEYKHVARYINGEVTYDEMFAQLLQDIYHLAKRQDTWFRGMERRGLPVQKIPRGDISALPPYYTKKS